MTTDPSPSLVLALQRAAHQVLTALEDAARTMGLSPSEMNVLANLLADREFTAAELAGASGLRPSTLTGVLDRLEAAALVLRSPHSQDRRAVVVNLTPSGRSKAGEVHEAVSSYEGRIHTVLRGTALGGFHEVMAAIGHVHRSTAKGPKMHAEAVGVLRAAYIAGAVLDAGAFVGMVLPDGSGVPALSRTFRPGPS